MLGEIFRDAKAVGELLRYSLSSSRTVEAAERELEFSTPGMSSRWELSFVNNTEETVYTMMMDEFEEGDVFFDIGANIGFYSCLFSEKASQVYAFEPNRHAANLLRQNIEKNSLESVNLIQVAASDENTSKELSKAPGSTVMGTAQINDSEDGDIDARTIDSLFEEDKLELPDLMKIDVEGHEIQVLKGMQEVLEKASPVIYVESHDRHEELKQTLEEMGYTYERLNKRLEGNIFFRAEPE